MELRDIRYFLVLCEELHFTRAADRCGVSQPCISAAIRKIETELGGTLIHRKPHPQLTPLGEAMRPLWVDALRKVEDSVALALARLQPTPEPAPPLQPAAPATLDEVREAMERLVADTIEAPPLLPEIDGEPDSESKPERFEDSDTPEQLEAEVERSRVVLARLRDQRIVASCRQRNGWMATTRSAESHGALTPPSGRVFALKRVRLAVAAVTMMLIAAAGFLVVHLPPGKLFGESVQVTSEAPAEASTSGAAPADH